MHIYEKTSEGIIPRHYVPMAKNPNQARPSTLRDLKKWRKEGLEVSPSVTEILNIPRKPALENWKIDQHLEIAWESGVNSPSVEEYIKDVKRLTAERMDKAPGAGTDFHKQMELYLTSPSPAEIQNYDLCKKVHAEILDHVGQTGEWQPEINIFSDDGYAGQCDLFIKPVYGQEPETLDSTAAWAIDYKTVDTKEKWAKKCKNGEPDPKRFAYWDSHLSQLIAYDMELTNGISRLVNAFVCLETGEIYWHEWTDEAEKEKAWFYFLACKELWEIKNL